MGEALILDGRVPQGISAWQNALKVREKQTDQPENVAVSDLQFKLANLLAGLNNYSNRN
jgi:hypothetical protein